MDKEETKTCPHCGQEILAVAKKCKYCKQFLEETDNTSTNENNIIENSANDKSKLSGKYCQRCEAQLLNDFSQCQECGAYVLPYLTKNNINQIENRIHSIKSSDLMCRIFEIIGISTTIYYIFAGGSIVEITYGVCSGILAIYFRIKRIHNNIEIQSLKKEIGLGR